MARVNVHLPDELAQLVRSTLPGLNVSAVVQQALRVLLDCPHTRLDCARCGAPVERRAMTDEALSRFYGDALWELDALVRNGGTAEGAGRVLKSVAERHAVSKAAALPLPCPSRANREAVRRRIESERRSA